MWEPITGDLTGSQTVVDGYAAGKSVILEFVLQEINRTDIEDFLYPWQTYSAGNTFPDVHKANHGPIIGQLISEVAGTLRLTPKPGSELAATIQYYDFRGIAHGPKTRNLNTRPSVVPILFQVLPTFENTYYTQYWKETTV